MAKKSDPDTDTRLAAGHIPLFDPHALARRPRAEEFPTEGSAAVQHKFQGEMPVISVPPHVLKERVLKDGRRQIAVSYGRAEKRKDAPGRREAMALAAWRGIPACTTELWNSTPPAILCTEYPAKLGAGFRPGIPLPVDLVLDSQVLYGFEDKTGNWWGVQRELVLKDTGAKKKDREYLELWKWWLQGAAYTHTHSGARHLFVAALKELRGP